MPRMTPISAALFLSAVLGLGSGPPLAGETSAPQVPDAPGRDAIWRSIFKRETLGTPADGALAARIALGRDLFRDPRLSGSEDRACASCHAPEAGFTDGRSRALARGGGDLKRNTPQLYNLAWAKALFWDGRAQSLEAQVRGPLLAPDEMAGDFGIAAARLEADPAMAQRFANAFPGTGGAIGEASITGALAAYERTLVSPETRFDRWVAGEDGALSEKELAGFRLFTGKAGCVACHGGWRFTDDGFHDIGLRTPDPGRGAVAGGVPGLAEFKTPGLRELAHTAPYMHDGSKKSLRDVIDHYAGGLEERPSLAQNVIRGLELSDGEKQALEAFLLTLSSESAALPK